MRSFSRPGHAFKAEADSKRTGSKTRASRSPANLDGEYCAVVKTASLLQALVDATSVAFPRPRLGEASDRVRFFFVDIENRVQLGDLQQILHTFGQAQQLQRAAIVRHRREAGNQFADA